jgi:hypothetical protein
VKPEKIEVGAVYAVRTENASYHPMRVTGGSEKSGWEGVHANTGGAMFIRRPWLFRARLTQDERGRWVSSGGVVVG